MDDFTTYGFYFEEALEKLEKLFIICQEANLYSSSEKCCMMFNEGIVLEHHISIINIKVDSTKIEVITKVSVPKYRRDIRSFLGFIGYDRIFIENFTKIISVLFKLVTKDCEFYWD